jgi:tRNA(Ile)-lysidine synthase
LIQEFTRFFRAHQIDIKNGRFLLAVSGGVDSVVLVELCRQAGLSFAIAHCNFGLRGAESDREEAFVRSLAAKVNVEVFVALFDTQQEAAVRKMSIQETARALRYRWFGVLQKEHGFAYTLLAHQADDNIETLLMHFFRGTGLNGLTGIPEQSDNEGRCLRPMLRLRREEIAEFAVSNNLQWMEDSSNAATKYTRNFFRHELLPQIRKVFPQAEENLLSNIERFTHINHFYKEAVTALKEKIIERKGNEVRIPVKKLLRQANKAVMYEIVKDYGFGEKQLPDIIHLTTAPTGKFISNDSFQIIRHGAWLLIVSVTAKGETIAIERDKEAVRFAGGSLHFTTLSIEKFSLNTSEFVAQLDAGEMGYPLLLRPPKAGDYFYPLGMRKKKKLARFFIDARLSKADKEAAWVLESAGRIVWIVGRRIDDRLKITGRSREVLQISFEKAAL